MRVKVVWLAPYPILSLEPELHVRRRPTEQHPCSWIVHLSNALARRSDVELHLITDSSRIPSTQCIHRGGIVFHVVKTGIPLLNRNFPSWLPLDVLSGFRPDVMRLLRTVHEIRPDVVHAHGTEAAYALTAVRSGIPCLISIQGVITEYFKTNPNFRFRIVRHYEQQAVQSARFFTCRTNFDSSFVRSQNANAQIFTIHEAMSPAYFHNVWKPDDSDRILYVGSLEKRKGIADLLRAVALVKRVRRKCSLQVIGRGTEEYTKSLRELCEREGITNDVQFLGFQPADQIAQRHLQAQVFVLPSENENSPNALAEAMVSGMPVIATRVGGIPSLVDDGQTGLLVPWGDPNALAEKIDWLLAHPQERERLGLNARRIARDRHNPDRVAEQTVDAYQEILRTEHFRR
jgi:glycosyltransferase involved in cell wall biosynthesis